VSIRGMALISGSGWRRKTKVKIQNIQDLASHLGAAWDTEQSIARRLFKDTRCGVSAGIEADGTGFRVSGYCEGSDWEHPVHVVSFPCTEKQIDDAVSQADEDGCATWNQTHACEGCYPEGNADEWGNEFLPGEAGGPINPDCSECGGDGIAL
jgi:hypothetical protein